jgi:peptidoglycan/LPS O-acetylase OafA/YrhL
MAGAVFPMQTDRTAFRYEALDGLRGVAALAVMAGHFGLLLDAFWLPNNFLAVDIFFIMSGFVIAHSYGDRLQRDMSATTYLYRRVVRLYPMFIVGLLLGTAVLLYAEQRGSIEYDADSLLQSVLLNIFYIPFFNTLSVPFFDATQIHYEVGQIFPTNPPAWSLFFEMLASGAFLLLFNLRLRARLLISLACYLVLVAVGVYYGRARGELWIDIHNGYETSNFLGGFPRVAFGFSLGVSLHALQRSGIAGRIPALLEKLPYPSFVLYAVLLAMLLFDRSAHGLYPVIAMATVAPAIVFAAAHINLRAGFEKKIATFLGWISYPIYCLHYPVARLVMFVRDDRHGSAWLPLLVSGTVALALAIVLTRWYEEPLRAALSGRSRARMQVPASEES